MEEAPNFESREKEIDLLIEKLAEAEEMTPDDILSDIVTFISFDGTEMENPEYFEVLAEKLGITIDEMNEYAKKKAE